jgi:hypothetical protein
MVLVVSQLGWYFLNQTRAIFTEELQKRVLSLTVNLAHHSKYGVLTANLLFSRACEGVLQEESVLFVLIADALEGVRRTTDRC